MFDWISRYRKNKNWQTKWYKYARIVNKQHHQHLCLIVCEIWYTQKNINTIVTCHLPYWLNEQKDLKMYHKTISHCFPLNTWCCLVCQRNRQCVLNRYLQVNPPPQKLLLFYCHHFQSSSNKIYQKYTICMCQGYICSTVKLCQFLQFLPKCALYSSSSFTTMKNQLRGVDMERLFTPQENFYLWKTFYPRGYLSSFTCGTLIPNPWE